MHQTRSEMPNEWPMPRKETKYIAVARHSKTKGIPLLFILRIESKKGGNSNKLKLILLVSLSTIL